MDMVVGRGEQGAAWHWQAGTRHDGDVVLPSSQVTTCHWAAGQQQVGARVPHVAVSIAGPVY